eukprot:CAMPEP_0181192980 /NCGR_PEP_ID=MMETSP1096-20121128/13574_1 /TAXON_ID=156174 ORGANISM="Chrysochromulina ericina, Strain CCMP281" /NCGR_SAMPLE_ID=MMETSP1096 /ASSEMBLY_ACC=CAM_ASM_000453 /LENGTH=86 /DNA_ID=CAMNT_0023282415 /DNA_START=257 /DNA_END=517 /DNA_ORIENTATION=-
MQGGMQDGMQGMWTQPLPAAWGAAVFGWLWVAAVNLKRQLVQYGKSPPNTSSPRSCRYICGGGISCYQCSGSQDMQEMGHTHIIQK